MKTLATLIISFGMSCHAEAAHICWVERVAKHNEELRVFMGPRYIGAVRAIAHSDGTRFNIAHNEDDFFTLKEGDSVYLSTLPHDVCTAKAVTVDGILGLKLTANTCMHGIGCQSTNEFVPSE